MTPSQHDKKRLFHISKNTSLCGSCRDVKLWHCPFSNDPDSLTECSYVSNQPSNEILAHQTKVRKKNTCICKCHVVNCYLIVNDGKELHISHVTVTGISIHYNTPPEQQQYIIANAVF